jgi:hypothetical protein
VGHKDAASGGVFSAEPGGHLLGRAHDGTVQHDVLFTLCDMSRQCCQVERIRSTRSRGTHDRFVAVLPGPIQAARERHGCD